MLNSRNFLHGKLVGIGKVHTDGSEDFRWLEKPIHNRIVSGGLDHLLSMNGGNEVADNSSNADSPKLFYGRYSNSTGKRCGVLHFSAYGTSDAAGAFTDAELKNRTSNYTSSIKVNDYMTGTCVVSYGEIILRITHVHGAAAAATSVREIGWFYDIVGASPEDYRMFSRVVLDSPYELAAGEQLISTYELSISFGNKEAVSGPSFYGLLDRDGNPLQYESKLCVGQHKNQMYYNGRLSFPYFQTNNSSNPESFSLGNEGAFASIYPMFCSYRGNNHQLSYNATNTGAYPFLRTRLTGSQSGDMDRYEINNDNTSLPPAPLLDVRPYTPGTFYRDAILTVPKGWPNLSGDSYIDINFLLFNGIGIAFGYWDNDTWVRQYYRKYGNKYLRLSYRQQWATVDTQ